MNAAFYTRERQKNFSLVRAEYLKTRDRRDGFNPLVVTKGDSFLAMRTHTWTSAVEYLVSHAGRWVPSVEIADHVYEGVCHQSTPKKLIGRAKRAGVPIESSVLGYRIGRNNTLACPDCGALRVRYPDGELVCYGCVGTEFVDLEVGRTPYDPNTRQGKAWTEADLQYIRDNRATMSNEAMARALNRTESGVRGQSTAMGLGRKAYIKVKE